MIIPGLIPAGAQQDAFKAERKTIATAVAGVPYEPLSELPLEDEQQPEQQSRQPREEVIASDARLQPDEAEVAEATQAGGSDLPRKGLMVDIRA